MGFEHFQVNLTGGGKSYKTINQELLSMEQLKADNSSVMDSDCYLMSDGKHVIEIELNDSSPIRLSCRFTLCHPPSIDQVFLNFIKNMMATFDMNVTILDDVEPDSYSLQRFDQFASILPRYIALKRSYWISEMGDELLSATTHEVYQQIILPRSRDIS